LRISFARSNGAAWLASVSTSSPPRITAPRWSSSQPCWSAWWWESVSPRLRRLPQFQQWVGFVFATRPVVVGFFGLLIASSVLLVVRVARGHQHRLVKESKHPQGRSYQYPIGVKRVTVL
jgi:hypothetical protein